MAKTAEVASNFHGDQLYQRRARLALPILVRQALAGNPIVYEDLAVELDMPNPRNLNYPLGCIGEVLNVLAKEWGSEIPHIQALVVNKGTGLLGLGFDDFLEKQGATWASPIERRAVIKAYWRKITTYPYWSRILSELELAPTEVKIGKVIADAAKPGGSGEGDEHKSLKELVIRRPFLVGLYVNEWKGNVEYYLPSGDSIDVVFETAREIYAIEVKPTGASDADVARGLFQCVKYTAVLAALAAFRVDARKISVVLALGGTMPPILAPLRNSLGIRVFEGLNAHLIP